ncbi:MAG TPA: DUF962 domain-containing protein [Candidatus Acidoferrales bacterium]|jgi:uncharacterized membrane protein YGL010W|nr:DUF962 domain-containing protein [Candidatus Acidoferrales bacterium]
MAPLSRYMSQYDHEHNSPWNKLLHAIGIPVIFAGIVLLILLRWKLGLALFVGGWVMLLLGHRIEGNKPAFFQGPVYFLVGPVWVAKELFDALRGRSHGADSPRGS